MKMRKEVVTPIAPTSKNYLRDDYKVQEWRNGELVTIRSVICYRVRRKRRDGENEQETKKESRK